LDWRVPTRCYYGKGGGVSLYDGKSATADPFALVVSLNEHRRHLTPSQRAMIAERFANMRQGQRTDVARPSANLPKVSQEQAAKALRVSTRQVGKAAAIRKKAAPEVVASVEKGKMTLEAAGRTIKRSKPTQTDLEEFTNKPQPAPKWSPWERERRARTEDGVAVVASKRRDHALIAWAEANDRIVLIDRQSIWGNPFEMGDEKDPKDGDRATVIENYRWYLERRPSLRRKLDLLRGKVLVCWCHPEPCHGDVLCDLVNDEPRAANGQIDPLEVPAFLLRGAATIAAD
jgi:hypothetical protein